MKVLSILCALMLSASTVSAQSVSDCNAAQTDFDAIPEPWSEHTKSFANGQVRLAVLDMIEPAAGAYHILVLSPPQQEFGARLCQIISNQDMIGFTRIDFAALASVYDSEMGLTFGLPVQKMKAGGGIYDDFLAFSVDQSTGSITQRLESDVVK